MALVFALVSRNSIYGGLVLYVVLLSKLLSIVLGNLPFEIALIADQHEGELFEGGVFCDLIHPVADLDEALVVADVIDDDDSVYVAVVVGGDVLPLLLAGGVPD